MNTKTSVAIAKTCQGVGWMRILILVNGCFRDSFVQSRFQAIEEPLPRAITRRLARGIA
jgi:hypothetical protein